MLWWLRSFEEERAKARSVRLSCRLDDLEAKERQDVHGL